MRTYSLSDFLIDKNHIPGDVYYAKQIFKYNLKHFLYDFKKQYQEVEKNKINYAHYLINNISFEEMMEQVEFDYNELINRKNKRAY